MKAGGLLGPPNGRRLEAEAGELFRAETISTYGHAAAGLLADSWRRTIAYGESKRARPTMLLILAIVIGILAFVSGLIGMVGLFSVIGLFAVISRISRIVFSVLAVAFVVLLVLLVF